MDIRDHLNLINNHNYKGYIAIYTGPKQISINTGDVVLVEDGDDKEVATTEKPMSKEDIERHKAKGSGLRTNCCCVCVPLIFLERILI